MAKTAACAPYFVLVGEHLDGAQKAIDRLEDEARWWQAYATGAVWAATAMSGTG